VPSRSKQVWQAEIAKAEWLATGSVSRERLAQTVRDQSFRGRPARANAANGRRRLQIEKENNVKTAKTRLFPLFVVVLVSAAMPILYGPNPAALESFQGDDLGRIEIGTLNQRLVMGA
jgi:hypothetical protein